MKPLIDKRLRRSPLPSLRNCSYAIPCQTTLSNSARRNYIPMQSQFQFEPIPEKSIVWVIFTQVHSRFPLVGWESFSKRGLRSATFFKTCPAWICQQTHVISTWCCVFSDRDNCFVSVCSEDAIEGRWLRLLTTRVMMN